MSRGFVTERMMNERITLCDPSGDILWGGTAEELVVEFMRMRAQDGRLRADMRSAAAMVSDKCEIISKLIEERNALRADQEKADKAREENWRFPTASRMRELESVLNQIINAFWYDVPDIRCKQALARAREVLVKQEQPA